MTSKNKLPPVITALLISMFMGRAFGAPSVMQHELTIQNGQGATVEKVRNDKTSLEPRQIRIKADSAPEDKAGRNGKKMEKYKIPADGEGERKVK